MQRRTVVVGGAVAAILIGVATFVLGLRQPTELHVGMTTNAAAVMPSIGTR
jgi:hypothetical protein